MGWVVQGVGHPCRVVSLGMGWSKAWAPWGCSLKCKAGNHVYTHNTRVGARSSGGGSVIRVTYVLASLGAPAVFVVVALAHGECVAGSGLGRADAGADGAASFVVGRGAYTRVVEEGAYGGRQGGEGKVWRGEGENEYVMQPLTRVVRGRRDQASSPCGRRITITCWSINTVF